MHSLGKDYINVNSYTTQYKKMKKIVFTILLVFLVFSCNDVGFVKSQPINGNNLSSFPKEIKGIYVNTQTKDTLKIKEKSIEFGDKKSSFYFYGNLSDKLKIKNSQGKYLINYKTGLFWRLYLVEENRGVLIVKSLNLKSDKELESLKKIVPIKTVKDSDFTMAINPTTYQLKEIIEKGLFTEELSFKKI